MQRKHKMICFLLLPLLFHAAFAVKHQLNYFLTASSGIPDLPEFMAYSMFDGVQWAYCDSSGRAEPEQEWAKKFFQNNSQRYEYFVNGCELYRYRYRGQIENLKQQLNQSEEMWVAAKPQALITKHKWDEDLILNKERKDFYTQHCPDRIKTFMEYVKRFEKRPARPSVSLLQRTPSSPVSCHATGFYLDSAVMSWRKDGQEMDEDVHHWEILPNPDGTFQMTVELEISSIKPEDWRRYQCVFNLSGVKEEIVTRLDRASIRTNWVSPSEFPAAAVAVGVTGLVLLALFITGLFIWKRQKNGFKPANASEPSSSELSSDAASH